MVKITIAEELQYLTEGITEIEIPSNTVNKVLSSLFSKFPQLYVFLMDNMAIESQRTLLILNDDTLLDGSDNTLVLGDTDTLHLFYGIPFGEASALATITTEMVVQAVVKALIMAVVYVAVSYAIGAIMGALVDDVKTPESSVGAGSPTYTFSGIVNTTASGTPVGLVYGKHRVGGHIISLFTEYRQDLNYQYKTFLLYQIGLSEGEISEVSDININKLPSAYFKGVSTPDIRLGTSDQTAMTEFTKIESTTTIGRKITNVTPKLTEATRVTTTHKPVYGVVFGGGLYLGPYTYVTA